MRDKASSDRRLLVLGASGFLGSNVLLTLCDAGGGGLVVAQHSSTAVHIPPGVQSVRADLSVPCAAADLVYSIEPDMVINCVALADVDACEHQPALAARLNASLPDEIARACRAVGSRFVHVSTDAVFDGTGGPYHEYDTPAPLNIYGKTKAEGESAALRAWPETIVARTNIVGWSPSGRRSLLEFFLNNLASGRVTPGFDDIYFRPLPVHWFWPWCQRIVEDGAYGIQHLTGPERLSKYDFGCRVARVFGCNAGLVAPTSGRASDRTAVRAANLDVLPSTSKGGGTIDDGLRELAVLERSGFRRRLRDLVAA